MFYESDCIDQDDTIDNTPDSTKAAQKVTLSPLTEQEDAEHVTPTSSAALTSSSLLLKVEPQSPEGTPSSSATTPSKKPCNFKIYSFFT